MTGAIAAILLNINTSENVSHSVADTLAHAVEHGGEQAAEHAPEFPNLIEIANHVFHTPLTQLLFDYRIVIYSIVVALFLSLLAFAAFRKRSLIPGPAQNLMEWIVESLAGMVETILGKQGRKYVPFLGTLFIYIFCMNLMGLIPGMFSSTSMLNTTLALAICVFLYVQYSGIRNLGVIGYMHHMAGSPKSFIEWCLVPLFFPLHIIGELAKPVSLSLRLFGNIYGEDILLAIFATLGVAILSFTKLPIGLPLHIPFIFLAILTSFVQALVFSLLATIYFSLMTHNEEENH